MLKYQSKTLNPYSGFTLIELSIVLVIIGLIVGSVLVGTSLIKRTEAVSAISQIEEYKIAAQTFKMKTGYLPGDIIDPDATSLGLHERKNCIGFGNGDGLIKGVNNVNGSCATAGTLSSVALNGESLLHWQDLARMNLINKGLQRSTVNTGGWNIGLGCTSGIDKCFPKSEISNENFVTIWSGGYKVFSGVNGDGNNYYSISKINSAWPYSANIGISVNQAFQIDSKIDDGLPQSGNILALLPSNSTPAWSGVGGTLYSYTDPNYNAPVTTATAYEITNCYDNNGIVGTQLYSLKNGDSINCGISFKWK